VADELLRPSSLLLLLLTTTLFAAKVRASADEYFCWLWAMRCGLRRSFIEDLTADARNSGVIINRVRALACCRPFLSRSGKYY
jgi:hypothetical protein